MADSVSEKLPGMLSKSRLLDKVVYYKFEDTSTLDAPVDAPDEASVASKSLGKTHDLIAKAVNSKPCPTCRWLCEESEIECFRCGFRFNVDHAFMGELKSLGANIGTRQVRFDAPFNSARLAATAQSSLDAFLLRLQAEDLKCSSGFDELLALPQLNVDHYDYQIATVQRVLKDMRGTALLADEVGLGKAQPLDAKVLTPTGWTTMGELCVGSKVIGKNGRATTVTGVYPQGEKDIYRVNFDDDSSTECCDDHLWAVNTSTRNWRKNDHEVLPLSQIRKRLRNNAGARLRFIPMVEPVHFAPLKKELPLHPYLLGLLLGDGGLAHHPRFSSEDDELINTVRRLVPEGVELNYDVNYDWHFAGTRGRPYPNPLTVQLRILGLMGHKAETKFIPADYLLASIDEREALLQGLLDTDGHVRPEDNNVEFSTVSPQLARDVQMLVQSLGGTASLTLKKTSYTYKGVKKAGQLANRLNIIVPNSVKPFRLTRKAEVYHPRMKYQPHRVMVSVDYVGKKPAQCIKVAAADELYVTDDFIVTHNTIEAGMILKELDARSLVDNILILAPAGLMYEPWQETMRDRFGMDFEVIRDEKGWEAVRAGSKRIIVSLPMARQPAHLARLLQTEWDMLVIDEAHYLKNRSTQSFKAVNRIRKRYCLMLTATPVQNDLMEMYGLLSLLKPGHLGTVRKFRNQYMRPDKAGEKVKNPAALQQLLYQVMVRNRRATVGLKLPKRTAAVVHLKASKTELDLYNDLSSFIRTTAKANKTEKNIHLSLTSLQRQLASSAASVAPTLENMAQDVKRPAAHRSALADFALRARAIPSEVKVEATIEIVKIAGGQFIVFAEYVQSIHSLERAFAAAGIKAVPYMGKDMDAKKKLASLNAFRNGTAQVLIATRTGAEGHNLQFCHQMINFDLPWNPMAIEQRIGRLHRIGQKEEVTVYNLAVNGTIEEHVLQVLADKLRMFNLVVGELDMVLGQMEGSKTFQELLHEAWLDSNSQQEAMKNIDNLGDKLSKARDKHDKIQTNNSTLDAVLAQVPSVARAR